MLMDCLATCSLSNGLLSKCIESLRIQLDRHRKDGLKEYPTRTIFIDPLLTALGWDVCDPDEVELEHPTVDGKSVDYAMKVNRKVVLHLEAKQLGGPLDDVKSITQVVGYAANDGIEWCVLTNGVRYKVYKASEKASAPDKLLFEVSIDPKDAGGLTVEDLARQFNRLSRESMAKGLLDQLGTEIFTTGKVRKALDHIFAEAPASFVRLIRKTMSDPSVTPSQIEEALRRIWDTGKQTPPATPGGTDSQKQTPRPSERPSAEYSETHHMAGKRDADAIANLLASRGFKFSTNYTPKVNKGAWVPKVLDDIQRWEMLESGKFTRDEIDLVTGDRRHTWFDRTVQDMKDSGAKPVFRE
jgi:hypothetical protein